MSANQSLLTSFNLWSSLAKWKAGPRAHSTWHILGFDETFCTKAHFILIHTWHVLAKIVDYNTTFIKIIFRHTLCQDLHIHTVGLTRGTLFWFTTIKKEHVKGHRSHMEPYYMRIQLGASSVSRTICHAASAEDINNDIEPVSRRKMQGSEVWPILHL